MYKIVNIVLYIYISINKIVYIYIQHRKINMYTYELVFIFKNIYKYTRH